MRKTNVYRLCVLAIAMLVSLSVLSGCSEQTASGKTEHIVIWTPNSHSKSFYLDKVAQWNKTEGKKNGLEIEYIVKEGNLQQMLELAFTSDQAPDFFTGGQLSNLVKNDSIAAIDDLPGGDKTVNKFKPYSVVGTHIERTDNKTYSVPLSVTTNGLIYNKDMFKEAGIVDENGEATPPKTLKEYREYAKKLTDKAKNKYGIMLPIKWSGTYGADVIYFSAASCGLLEGYNAATGKYDYSAVGEVMKTLNAIKADGSLFPGADSLDNDAARARFATGNVGMKVGGSYDYSVLKTQFPAGFDWGVAPIPTVNESDSYWNFLSYDSGFRINKKTVDRIGGEKVMKIYEFLTSDEFVIDLYKKCYQLPYSFDLVKDAKLDNEKKQWGEFAKLIEISRSLPAPMPTDMSGKKDLRSIWTDEIWLKNYSDAQIDEVISDYNAAKNNGIEDYKKIHPEFKPENYIIPEYNAKR